MSDKEFNDAFVASTNALTSTYFADILAEAVRAGILPEKNALEIIAFERSNKECSSKGAQEMWPELAAELEKPYKDFMEIADNRRSKRRKG